ncbi:unnamed protein product [Echinostoma caproni]|uniref:UDENN domain-containing protein n=1 Tax=Echinostoma caproni TaxID=27848 RepID=A0A183BC30_9TREM|nr:unnamed protein product [Echinostoma caproni]
MLCKETECRRRAERARDSLRRKVNVIREVLAANDVNEAKRHLDDVDLSALTPNKSFNNTRLDHSAGSLLDPVNVSVESTNDETVPNKSCILEDSGIDLPSSGRLSDLEYADYIVLLTEDPRPYLAIAFRGHAGGFRVLTSHQLVLPRGPAISEVRQLPSFLQAILRLNRKIRNPSRWVFYLMSTVRFVLGFCCYSFNRIRFDIFFTVCATRGFYALCPIDFISFLEISLS